MSTVQTALRRGKKDAKQITLLSDNATLSEVTEWIPSGFNGLDVIMGGGWPVGRCSEVFGPEGIGKSALTHRAIKACQDRGGTAVYLDFEIALDPDKMKQQNIKADQLIYCQPDTLEAGWDLIWKMLAYVEKNPPDAPMLIVWDSIAGSVPEKVLKGAAGDHHVAAIAGPMSENCPKLFKKIARLRAHVLFVNQERVKMGGGGMFQEFDTPGGKALKYAVTVRIRVQKVKTLKQGHLATGYLVKATTRKNRLFPPHRSTTWVLDFQVGPSPELTLFEQLKDMKIIKTARGRYTAPWSKETFKRSQWVELMREDAEFRQAALEAEAEKVLPALSKGVRLDEADDDDDDDDEDE